MKIIFLRDKSWRMEEEWVRERAEKGNIQHSTWCCGPKFYFELVKLTNVRTQLWQSPDIIQSIVFPRTKDFRYFSKFALEIVIQITYNSAKPFFLKFIAKTFTKCVKFLLCVFVVETALRSCSAKKLLSKILQNPQNPRLR